MTTPATTPADGELKPCPFCGGDPEMVQQTKVNWAVMCHDCGAEGGWGNPSAAIDAWNKRATPSFAYPCQPFAIVTDRTYSGEGPTLAVWNGENYNFSDGDCFDREHDGTLDGYSAEWLTHYQLEQRLFATPSPGKAERKKLDTDLLATIREAARTRAEGAITQDGRAVFINYGNSEQQMLDGAEMACQHCGGSGHKDDASPGKADAEDAARYRWIRDQFHGDALKAAIRNGGPALDEAVDAAMFLLP